ncbi:creatininase family protein [Citrobacter meridianamericanus]|uniref:Creatininase family protein n=1 Tax=Citrobacter meridianamericanus TaxID=2894201 RepID=A0ABT1B6B4_9ENTR|nr:creatininase family protein [Citrobacter meridianamericanus]MCO5781387.1 creatininase family protein [Citrobacter meridianamericanus]
MKKVMLNEFTGKEIRQLLSCNEDVVAIVSFGSCENHADHLPLGPDYFVPEEVARRVAVQLDKTIVVPCTPFGTSQHYNSYPMAISIRFETNIMLAEDIFNSLIHHGIKRIFIINGHDGNIPAIEIAARNVKENNRNVSIVFIPAWWDMVGKKLGDSFFESWSGTGLGHGGEGETSAVMAVRPDLVHLEDAIEQIPADVFDNYGFTYIWDISEISMTGATGSPSYATKEKGDIIINCLVDCIVNKIKQLNQNGWNYAIKKIL